ncbi:AAA family ATPase [uncultured Rothia sp.]|uniref:AAA family ATPase n=1 Tax=uncultured Rothia sp. TaxID=316088 RepID=UPI0032162281
MRIHRLKLTAYGPFPDSVNIDFEELNDAGIFLLNGPTGSGKSSILDAICFALYGTTSLNRPDLKSHFAAEDIEPRVELECTVGGSHLRIERSPKWLRPKKRGTGYLLEHAKVLVEREDPINPGHWETKAERNDEAGAYIADLIGLTREQFTQVMLLPQGEFARFLTSKSADREDLLKRLFPTISFEKVQEELQIRARCSYKKAELALRDVERIEDRAEQSFLRSALTEARENLSAYLEFLDDDAVRTSIKELLESPEVREASEGEPQELEEKLALRATHLKNGVSAVAQARKLSQKSTQQISEAVREIVELGDHWRLYQKLSAQFEQILEQQPEHRDRKNRLAQAQSALRVLPLLKAARSAEHKKNSAQKELDQVWDHLRDQGTSNLWLALSENIALQESISRLGTETFTSLTEQSTHELLESLQEKITLTRELLNRESTAHRLELSITTHAASLKEHRSTSAQLEDEVSRTQLKIEETQKILNERAHAEVELAEFLSEFQQAQETVRLSNQREEQDQRREKAAQIAHEAEHQRKQLAQKAEDLQGQRYAQAAQILAQNLKEDSPCPVCGSAQHPSPAVLTHATGLVEEADIEEARQQRNQAEQFARISQQTLAAEQEKLKALDSAGALEPDLAHKKFAMAQQEKNKLQGRTKELHAAQELAKKLQETRENNEKKQQEAQIKLARLESEIQVLSNQRDEHLSTLEGYRTNLSLEQTEQEQLKLSSALTDFMNQGRELLRAEETYREQEQLAQDALKESSFENAEEVRALAVEKSQLQKLEDSIFQFERDLNRLQTRLEEPAMKNIRQKIAAQQSPPDEEEIQDLAARQKLAQARDEQLLRWETQLSRAATDYDDLIEDHTQLTQRNEKLLNTARMHRRMAEIAAGNSVDNRLAMSLTTFVLASQLEEVTQSATLHLETMTHGRYRLHYTDEKQGRGKSGLEIAIFDTWHAKTRVPATLSGGETFMASLALALGLADVVQQRNGGIEIDTLFVDEGFGTLDESTLEEVMGTLDSLREGGRVIGLISHVAEMKNRIPLHITLHTSPEGSTIAAPQR